MCSLFFICLSGAVTQEAVPLDSSAYSSDQDPGHLLYIRIMLPSYIGISALLSRKCWSVLQLVSRALRSKVENPLIFRDYFIGHYEDSFINESTNQDFLECHSRVWPSLLKLDLLFHLQVYCFDLITSLMASCWTCFRLADSWYIFGVLLPPKKNIEKVFQL